MSRLRVAPIVEGHGDVIAVPQLLRRVWRQFIRGEYIEVLQPIRQPRSKLLKPGRSRGTSVPDAIELQRAVKLASLKLDVHKRPNTPGLVLILLDANSDCPKELAPKLLEKSRAAASPQDIAVVLATVEYETWFVAAAPSLDEFLRLGSDNSDIHNAERKKLKKKWVQDRFLGPKYSETVDQVKLTDKMDLAMCRENSPSFDKLCREFERRAAPDAQGRKKS